MGTRAGRDAGVAATDEQRAEIASAGKAGWKGTDCAGAALLQRTHGRYSSAGTLEARRPRSRRPRAAGVGPARFAHRLLPARPPDAAVNVITDLWPDHPRRCQPPLRAAIVPTTQGLSAAARGSLGPAGRPALPAARPKDERRASADAIKRMCTPRRKCCAPPSFSTRPWLRVPDAKASQVASQWSDAVRAVPHVRGARRGRGRRRHLPGGAYGVVRCARRYGYGGHRDPIGGINRRSENEGGAENSRASNADTSLRREVGRRTHRTHGRRVAREFCARGGLSDAVLLGVARACDR